MRYYYLISTLPDLSPGTVPKDLDIGDTIQLIRDNLEEDDRITLNYLLFMNDNSNLINLICEKRKGGRIFPVGSPSFYDMKELSELMRSRFELPDYMSDFLVRFEDQANVQSVRFLEENLWFNFYDEVNVECNGFIKEYYQFDRELRTHVNNTNARLFPEQNLTSQLSKGSKGHQTSEYEVINDNYDELHDGLQSKQPKFIQISMDKIRWEFADRYQPVEFFSANHVYAYFLKLMMLEKWQRLREIEDPDFIGNKINAIISNIDSLQNILK